MDIPATNDATHNKLGLHVIRRIYAGVRDLQVVQCGQPHSEKAGVARLAVNRKTAGAWHASQLRVLNPSRENGSRTARMPVFMTPMSGLQPVTIVANVCRTTRNVHVQQAAHIYPLVTGSTQVAVLTDTSDTVFNETDAYQRNYRNCSLRSNSLVTRINTGYYHGSVVFIDTCAG